MYNCSHEDMQLYRWPGHEMQLLRELQRQQNNTQFCDVLLKTEGISVPTHSCVLAAFSPYLSQRLLASPSPQLGQKRELWLQAVKTQTLLKLVGLFYCGEVEVNGSAEHDDLLSAAGQCGIHNLVNGRKNAQGREGELQKSRFGSFGEKNESREIQGAPIQAGLSGGRNTVHPVERRNCVSTGKPNVKADQKTVGCSLRPSVQTEQPHPVPEPSVVLQPQRITRGKICISSAPPPHIPMVHSETQSVPNPTPLLSSSGRTFLVSPNEDLNSTTPPEDSADRIQVLDEEGPGPRDGKTMTAPPSQRDEMPGKERGRSAEKRHAHVGMKSLSKIRRMQQMAETESTHISIKVKLRRSSSGKGWEVVSLQDTEDGSSHKRLQADPMSSEPPLSTHKPETQMPQPATSHSTDERPQPDSDSQLLSSDFFNEELESVPLTQPPGSAEECDEQMDRLLEDIMMGLNILPNVDRDCKESHCLQTNHEEVLADCRVPGPENEQEESLTHVAAGTEGCEYYQDEMPVSNAATNAGIYCNFPALNQPGCPSLSSAQPAAVPLQEHQTSPWDQSAATPVGEREVTGLQGATLSKTLNCQLPDALSGPRPFMSLSYFPVCQEPPSLDNRRTVELFPQVNTNGAESLHPLPCVDGLRLPQCLSPLEPPTSAVKRQPDLNSSTNPSDNVEPRSSAQGQPWLEVKARILQYPLSAMTHRASEGLSLPLDSNRSNSLQLNPRGGETRTASCSVREAEEREAISGGHQNVAKEKSDLRNTKKSLKSKRIDTKGEFVVPKRRKRMRSVKVSDGAKGQIPLGVCLVSLSSNNVLAKEREMAASSNVPKPFLGKTNEPSTIIESLRGTTRGLGGPTTSPMRINSRGFLKKTQETPTSSSTESPVLKPTFSRAQIVNKQDIPKRGPGRPRKTRDPGSPLKTRDPGSPLKTRDPGSPLKTRDPGSPRKTRDPGSPRKRRGPGRPRKRRDPGSPLKKRGPGSPLKKRGPGSPLKKRGPGRPRKTEVKKFPPDKTNHGVKREEQTNGSLSKEESEKTRRCKKLISNESESEAVPPTAFDAGEGRNFPPHNATKPSRTIRLKEFQKLISRQHSKTRKSKNSQDEESCETAAVSECEEEAAARGSRSEELTQETETHIAEPQDRDRLKECPHVCDVKAEDADDNNNNHIFDKSAAEDDESQRDETNVSASNVSRPALGEEAELAAETENCPDDGRGEVGSGENPQTAIHDEGASHSDAHLPQEDNMPMLSHLQRTSAPQWDDVRSVRSSGCDEEEEVEVDVVLFSPDIVSPTQECENGLEHVEITPEDEDEEDGNEIDVTGDEAE